MKSKKKLIILFFLLLIILSFCLIGVGIYFSHIATPKYIMGKVIDEFSLKIEDVWHDYDIYRTNDNYTSENIIKFNFESEQLAKDSLTNPEALKSYQFIKNLNQLQSQLTIMKDSNNNKSFISLQQNLGNEEILNAKYVIDNSTKYYFVNQVLNNYVNGGNCNYFESLSNENTSSDNIEYLYHFIKKSLKNHLSEEYFNEYTTNQEIADKNQNIRCISLKLTDKTIKKILNDILNDLKKDKKANKILSGIDNNFNKSKISNKTSILSKEESFTINVYTSTIMYKPIKYEIIHINKNDKSTLSYEKSKNQGDLYLANDNKVKYHLIIKSHNNTLSVNIFDSQETEIGSLQYTKNDKLISLDFDFDNSKNKYQLKLTSKFHDIKRKEAYINNTEISFKHINNKISVLTGNIIIDTKLDNKVNITEDISNAVLSSTLTPEQRTQFKLIPNNILERLERP